MPRRCPIISQSFAHEFGLTIESTEQYCQRNFIQRPGAIKRVKRGKAYAYKLNGRWWFVTKNGEDLKDIIV